MQKEYLMTFPEKFRGTIDVSPDKTKAHKFLPGESAVVELLRDMLNAGITQGNLFVIEKTSEGYLIITRNLGTAKHIILPGVLQQ